MVSLQPSSNLSIDEHQWIIEIRKTLDEDLEEDTEIPVSIFNVPKTLMASDPDSYIPQQVALGPHHHLRPELFHEMQRYKLAAAKRAQTQLQRPKFQQLVDHLINHEPRIRACYHKYLQFNGQTLAWMMLLDASFLLEFLHNYCSFKEGMVPPARMLHLFDVAGTKSAHNAILRDMVMLENQIPLFLLRKMLEFQFPSLESADDALLLMLVGFYKELSPFSFRVLVPNNVVRSAHHLLDFLYHMIVPKSEDQSISEIIEIDQNEVIKEGEDQEKSFGNSSYIKQLGNVIWKLLSKINKGPVSHVKRVLFSKAVQFILKLPWTIISNIPGFKILKQPLEFFISSSSQDKESKSENESSNNINQKPPLVEEITIPSVTELSRAGVHFLPSTGGSISTVKFDNKTVTLYLPTVSLDVNSEVIFRNLVAYEACNASGPLVFTRYTELMNGIIDTEEDAKLLREKRIILNRLKSDKEVANLWNGMTKSVKLTKVPCLDKVIEDVNKYYNCRWNVKVGKFMKVYVFGSWQFLTFLAAIFLFLFMILQSFCSMYSCRGIISQV